MTQQPKRSIKYTEIIANQCGDDVVEITCDYLGIHIGEADSTRRITLEPHEFDQLVAAVAKYDAMVAVATPKEE